MRKLLVAVGLVFAAVLGGCSTGHSRVAEDDSSGLTLRPQLDSQAELRKRVDELIEKLGSMKYHLREMATRELIQIGKPALPAVEKALKDRDIERAHRARFVRERILDQTKRRALEISITAPQKAFAKGQPFVITCHISNSGAEPLVIHLPNAISRPQGPLSITHQLYKGENVFHLNSFGSWGDLGHVYLHNFKSIEKGKTLQIPVSCLAPTAGQYSIRFVYAFDRLRLENFIVEASNAGKAAAIGKLWSECLEVEKLSNELTIEVK